MIRLDKLRRDLGRYAGLGRLLWPHARPHRGLLAGGAALSLAILLLQLAQPWPLKWIFDILSAHKHETAFHAPALRGIVGLLTDRLDVLFPGLHPSDVALALYSVLYVAIAAAAARCEFWQRLALNGLGNRVVYAFRSRVFRHLLRLPLAFHERREAGELITRVVFDTSRLRRGVNGFILRIIQSIGLFLGAFLILFLRNWTLASIAVLGGSVSLFSMLRTGRRIHKAARRQRRKEGSLSAVVEESLAGIQDLQTYHPEGAVDPRFERHNERSLLKEQKVRRLGAGLLLRVNLLMVVCLCAVLWLGTAEVNRGLMSPGDLILFLHYVIMLSKPLNQFARQTWRVGRMLACSDRLVRLLGRESELRDRPDAAVAGPFRGDAAFEEVRVLGLRLRRRKRRRILRRVSFAVRAGEQVAILGPNGAGKSTVIKLLARLGDPDRGRVLLDGRDVRDYTLASLRSQMSVVHQESVFFGLTVRENIALGAPGIGEDRIRAAAARAQVADVIERLPKGYETLVRRRGRLLSAGERQRLAVARALARDGRIWLLDEPTTGLDAAAAADLTELLRDATRGRTTFWATHDAGTARRLDRVLLLVKGRTAYDGPAAGLDEWLGKARNDAENPALRRYYEQLQTS